MEEPKWGRAWHKKLQVKDKDKCLTYLQEGTIFAGGQTSPHKTTVSVCDLFYFHGEIEDKVSKKFPNVYGNVSFWIKSPSIIWYDNSFQMSFRVRTKTPEHEKTRANAAYEDLPNYLYVRRYSESFDPIDSGKMIGIPVGMAKRLYVRGPHDARLFVHKEKLYGVLAAQMKVDWITFLWDFEENEITVPQIQARQDVSEKNWVPLLVNDTLHLVRHLDPLQILKCDPIGSCDLLRDNTESQNYKMKDKDSSLRGGTPFVLYKYPYYIGVAHGFVHLSYRFYTAHLVILCMEPQQRVVYVSKPHDINRDIYKKYGGLKVGNTLWDDFMFPVGLILEDLNTITVGVHINDKGSLLLRWRGISKLIDNVIATDLHSQPYGVGPKPFAVQTAVHEMVELFAKQEQKRKELKLKRQKRSRGSWRHWPE